MSIYSNGTHKNACKEVKTTSKELICTLKDISKCSGNLVNGWIITNISFLFRIFQGFQVNWKIHTHTQPPSHANTINMHRIYVHAMCAEIEFMQRQENRRIVLVLPVWRVRDFYIAVAISVRYALNAINTLAV